MNNGKMKGMTLALLMMVSALAGCIGGDDAEDAAEDVSTMDASDAGYTYASNVDNHRSLMKDLCDIKTAASESDWDTATMIYMNGKNAQKDDGSFRTLYGFASAEGKKHSYDAYYNMTGSVNGHIMSALNGDGDFAGASDTVRYQGIAKLTVNMGMVAYTIHELNSAIAKADAGNVDNDTGAPHNWDEGWAFFHGPDEDYSCSPAKVMEKRAGDFGTTNADGVANTFAATEAAMVDGLAALQAGDAAGYTAAADTVVKNLVITYSQAVLKYTSKMDNNESGEKYQAEGYAFWMAIEALVADHTDACYNNQTHGMAWIGAGNASNCDAFIWTQHNGQGDYMCYNTDLHIVFQAATNETVCDGFASVFPESQQPGYYADYGAGEMNKILDLTDATQLGTSYDVGPWLTGAWAHYGITSADIGTLQ